MTSFDVQSLSRELQAAVRDLKASSELEQIGLVTRVSDGIVWIYGLTGCGFGELLAIQTTSRTPVEALVLSLGEDEIGAILLSDEANVGAGAKVKLTGHRPAVPVGPELLGRVVDPLGRPLDGLGPVKTKASGPIERHAPGVIDRQSVSEPLPTGIMAIDTMTPIGRGQRQLIIGDRKTGKTAIVIDTILNQTEQHTGVVSIYVAIGQKRSTTAALIERLKTTGAMKNSIVVATSPADPAALLFLAPYAGMAMGEYFRDHGDHGLVVFDDLSKHAVAYRQLSLLLRRPPGREAYPGDVFYLHSRLLERSAKLSDDLGAGSLTALPIIETQAGDVSAYIPTNVISITDGQIYLESDLFYQGIRPAISVGLSVSRVGGAAQTKAMKSVASSLRVELAQFRELAAFTQLSSDLDAETQQQITRGRVLTEVLKQPQYHPVALSEQVVRLSAAIGGAFDHVPLSEVEAALATLSKTVRTGQAELMRVVATGQRLSDETQRQIMSLAAKITGPPPAAAGEEQLA